MYRINQVLSFCNIKLSTKFSASKLYYNWTPIARAFNNPDLNPDSKRQQQGLFNIPVLSDSYGFIEMQQDCLQSTKDLIGEALDPKRTRKIVEVFDDLSNNVCKVADLAEFIRIAHPDPEYKKRAEEAYIAVSGIVEK